MNIFDTLSVTNLDFQYSQGKHELKEALNCHHNYSTMQNDTDLKEEMTSNMSIECSAYNDDILEFLKREQNRGYSGIKNASGFSEYKGTEQGRIMNTELHYYLLFP